MFFRPFLENKYIYDTRTSVSRRSGSRGTGRGAQGAYF
ncbi:hypothetical protein LEP1GSC062_3097 [Leptospira alexanderi serovar Manhao 3 str. L 60]|uniref:Uncharacterized protein n=1 Tax=Leptospira alexanderi serovar Manhao 3 str. L 60 TaxID=1049759 RepID=V6I6K2_9LEPT|nr:hypothetical protein LEP1GSC062_3097 [Leptospira alexanderi serovar Manhao 3 str. L 60]